MTHRSARLRRALAPLALGAALALAGCGSSSTPSTPGATSGSPAPSDSVAAPSVAVGDTVSLSEIGVKSAAAMKEAKTGHATMEMGTQGSMKMDMDYAKGDFAMDMTTDDGTLTMLKVGKALYMGGMPDLPGGKKWVKITGEGDDPMSKAMAPLLESMSKFADPAAMMTAVEGLKATVTAVEGGTITYETTMTAAQVQELAMKALKEMSNGSPLPTPTGSATGGMTMTQTLDAKGLPVKSTIVVDQDGKKETMTMAYSKWGEPVTITEPPAAEVTSFAEMMKG